MQCILKGMVLYNMLSVLGRTTCILACSVFVFLIFTLEVIYHCFFSVLRFRELFLQIFRLGYLSLPIVGFTAIFTGAVLTLQSYIGFSRFNIESAIPGIVVISLTRELGPVLVGLIFAGRVGSGICAELSSMKVTEQIDALPTLYTNPFNYLICPRVIAGALTLPMLVIVADIIGVYGGYLVGVYNLGFNNHVYVENTINFLNYKDVLSGIVKALVFGFIVTITGCYYGYNCQGGAQGVGSATTKSVVLGSMLILLANYVITSLLFS